MYLVILVDVLREVVKSELPSLQCCQYNKELFLLKSLNLNFLLKIGNCNIYNNIGKLGIEIKIYKIGSKEIRMMLE